MAVAAATTRSTSDKSMAGNSGSVTVSRPIRSLDASTPATTARLAHPGQADRDPRHQHLPPPVARSDI